MLIFALFLLILFLIFFQYLKRAFSRARFVSAMKRECALKRYKLKKLGFFSLYFKNFSGGFDMEVDTGRHLYAIKLWDEAQKNANIIFTPGGRVYKRRKVTDVFGDEGQRSHSVLESKIGTLKLADGAEKGATYTRRYLLFDGIANIYSYDGNDTARVKRGDELYGMTVLLRTDILKNISAKDVS